MIEPDFITEEDWDNEEKAQWTYRIEIQIWHVVLSLLMFWIIIYKNTLRICDNVKWNPFKRRFDEKEIILFKKMLVTFSIADLLLVSSLLFVCLGCYLTYFNNTELQEPLGNELTCSNGEFILLVWCLFIVAYGIARHSVLILLSIQFVPGFFVFLWITSIILPVTLYYFVLPRLAVPRVEICLVQNQSSADVLILVFVVVLVVSSMMNARNCKRLAIWSIHHLKGNRSLKDSRKQELQEVVGVQSQYEKITHVDINVERRLNPLQRTCNMMLHLFIVVFACLPLCFLFWFSRKFQEVDFVVKLLLGGFAYACLSLWNVGIMKSLS